MLKTIRTKYYKQIDSDASKHAEVSVKVPSPSFINISERLKLVDPGISPACRWKDILFRVREHPNSMDIVLSNLVMVRSGRINCVRVASVMSPVDRMCSGLWMFWTDLGQSGGGILTTQCERGSREIQMWNQQFASVVITVGGHSSSGCRDEEGN